MGDLALEWAGDISLDDTGDFATVDATDELRQRIIRRFLTSSAIPPSSTNPQGSKGDDLFDQQYGGNARRYIDAVVNQQVLDGIKNRLLAQIAEEPEASTTVPPQLTVSYNAGAITVTGVVYDQDGNVSLIPETELN